MSRYRFIAAQKAQYSVAQLCRVLRVAPGAGEGQAERLIPFVAAHVDGVDLPAGRIDVDWQPDY